MAEWQLQYNHKINYTIQLTVVQRYSANHHHSFSIYSHKKAINVYMLTCSEADLQRCSHETGAPKNARQTRGRIPVQEYDFIGTASQLH